MYDQSWVEMQMLKYYSDLAMIPELASGAITLLTGSKSDMELQNEVRILLKPGTAQFVSDLT